MPDKKYPIGPSDPMLALRKANRIGSALPTWNPDSAEGIHIGIMPPPPEFFEWMGHPSKYPPGDNPLNLMDDFVGLLRDQGISVAASESYRNLKKQINKMRGIGPTDITLEKMGNDNGKR